MVMVDVWRRCSVGVSGGCGGSRWHPIRVSLFGLGPFFGFIGFLVFVLIVFSGLFWPLGVCAYCFIWTFGPLGVWAFVHLGVFSWLLANRLWVSVLDVVC